MNASSCDNKTNKRIFTAKNVQKQKSQGLNYLPNYMKLGDKSNLQQKSTENTKKSSILIDANNFVSKRRNYKRKNIHINSVNDSSKLVTKPRPPMKSREKSEVSLKHRMKRYKAKDNNIVAPEAHSSSAK